MSKLSSLTPIAAALAMSVAAAHAGDNPLALQPAAGMQLADAANGMEGKCGASMGMADEKAPPKSAPKAEKPKAKGMEGKCGASMGMGGKSAPKAPEGDKSADDKSADKPGQP